MIHFPACHHTPKSSDTHTWTLTCTDTQTQLKFLLLHLERGAETCALATFLPKAHLFTCLPSPLHLGDVGQNKDEHIEKNWENNNFNLLVRNWNPTRLLDKMQLFFTQQHIIYSVLETKAKDYRKLGDQERKQNTGGWLVIPHKWSGCSLKLHHYDRLPTGLFLSNSF